MFAGLGSTRNSPTESLEDLTNTDAKFGRGMATTLGLSELTSEFEDMPLSIKFLTDL